MLSSKIMWFSSFFVMGLKRGSWVAAFRAESITASIRGFVG